MPLNNLFTRELFWTRVSALIPYWTEAVVFESNMMRVRLDKTRLLPAFGSRLLGASPARSFFHSRAKSAIAQASINQTDIRDLPLAVPTVIEQGEIVRRVTNGVVIYPTFGARI